MRIPQRTSKFMLDCALVLAVFASIDVAHAEKGFKNLYSFGSQPNDGGEPVAGLIMDKKGNLYGTTIQGGSGCSLSAGGCGTVFELTKEGTETVLYSFKGGSDGAEPEASLIIDNAGNLYGTTYTGGGTGCNGMIGCGTVFKISPDGAETILYAFHGGSDGAYPVSTLIEDTAGNLYGTTPNGGDVGCSGGNGCGTVFKVAPDGTETVLYAFKGGSDGMIPYAGLIGDASGNLYGTTSRGGTAEGGSCLEYGCGTIFKVAPDGDETVLYSFCQLTSCADGATPIAGLVADAAGNLFGTTTGGGPIIKGSKKGGRGTIYELASNGAESVLYTFCQLGKCGDGRNPSTGVMMDAAGDFYGTTQSSAGCGVLFKLTPSGSETVVHEFETAFESSDGCNPEAAVVEDKKGKSLRHDISRRLLSRRHHFSDDPE